MKKEKRLELEYEAVYGFILPIFKEVENRSDLITDNMGFLLNMGRLAERIYDIANLLFSKKYFSIRHIRKSILDMINEYSDYEIFLMFRDILYKILNDKNQLSVSRIIAYILSCVEFELNKGYFYGLDTKNKTVLYDPEHVYTDCSKNLDAVGIFMLQLVIMSYYEKTNFELPNLKFTSSIKIIFTDILNEKYGIKTSELKKTVRKKFTEEEIIHKIENGMKNISAIHIYDCFLIPVFLNKTVNSSSILNMNVADDGRKELSKTAFLEQVGDNLLRNSFYSIINSDTKNVFYRRRMLLRDKGITLIFKDKVVQFITKITLTEVHEPSMHYIVISYEQKNGVIRNLVLLIDNIENIFYELKTVSDYYAVAVVMEYLQVFDILVKDFANKHDICFEKVTYKYLLVLQRYIKECLDDDNIVYEIPFFWNYKSNTNNIQHLKTLNNNRDQYQYQVIGSYVRKLPAGQKASDAAVQKAKEYHIELKNGYTLISEHKKKCRIYPTD